MGFLNFLLLPFEGGLILLVLYLGINEIIRWRARVKGVPGPAGLPVVGNLPQVSKQMNNFFFLSTLNIYQQKLIR